MNDDNNQSGTPLDPASLSHCQTLSSVELKSTEPADFNEGGSEHRKALLGNTALILVLIFAVTDSPTIFGVQVPVPLLWLILLVGQCYFFLMWRLTGPVESDSEKRFWNIGGLHKQAMLKGVRDFPGKTKAQLFLIRALPIWGFLIGSILCLNSLFRVLILAYAPSCLAHWLDGAPLMLCLESVLER